MRIDWQNLVLPRAVAIVESYDTGVTLRQLFYRLVSEELIPNTQNAYKSLSRVSAEARRKGEFPRLIDPTRTIYVPGTFTSPRQAREWLRGEYRRDRTEGQEWTVFLAVEKSGLVEQLRSWFGNPFGVPILALSGYTSQTYATAVRNRFAGETRPVAVLYGGDFDPSGMDIPRDFLQRAGGDYVTEFRRVALNEEQVTEYDLPPQPGKRSDSRASQFVERYGRLVQVELDALIPADLRALFQSALSEYWDTSAYESALETEAAERERL